VSAEFTELIEEIFRRFPAPTDEQYAAALAEARRAGDGSSEFSVEDVRRAAFHSIHCDTGKFDKERFWEVLSRSGFCHLCGEHPRPKGADGQFADRYCIACRKRHPL
jgi:hypothetical protein